MKYVTVDQFRGSDWVDVYVFDEVLEETLEVEQGLSLAQAFKMVDQFKKKYGVDDVLFNLCNRSEELVSKELW